jgi:hypothetical protein
VPPIEETTKVNPKPTSPDLTKSTFAPLPSLKDIQSKVRVEAKQANTSIENSTKNTSQKIELNDENIQEAIKNYAKIKKEDGKMVESIAISQSTVKVEGNTIRFQVSTELEIQHIETNKGEIISFLRNSFETTFQILIELIELKKENRLIYGSSDKYNYLVETYPLLELLKKTLGLEVLY